MARGPPSGRVGWRCAIDFPLPGRGPRPPRGASLVQVTPLSSAQLLGQCGGSPHLTRRGSPSVHSRGGPHPGQQAGASESRNSLSRFWRADSGPSPLDSFSGTWRLGCASTVCTVSAPLSEVSGHDIWALFLDNVRPLPNRGGRCTQGFKLGSASPPPGLPPTMLRG